MDIGSMERYIAPVQFNTDVKDILDHALFLKEQAEQAGVLQMAEMRDIRPRSIHRALLLLASEELLDEVEVDKAAKRLRRLMASIWS